MGKWSEWHCCVHSIVQSKCASLRVWVCVCVRSVYYYCCCFLECWSTIFLSSWSNKPRNVWHKTSKETFQLMLNAFTYTIHTYSLALTPFTWKKDNVWRYRGKMWVRVCKHKRKKKNHTHTEIRLKRKERKKNTNKNNNNSSSSTKWKRRRKIRNAKGFSIIWFNNNGNNNVYQDHLTQTTCYFSVVFFSLVCVRERVRESEWIQHTIYV